MQQKKKEMQQLIEKGALTVFFEKGYTDAKVGDIAAEVGISVGNIYTYFKNKDELFYTVVPESLVNYLEEIIVETIKIYNTCYIKAEDMTNLSTFLQKQMDTLLSYRMQLVIIFEKNQGTRYEGIKQRLIDLMIDSKSTYLASIPDFHDMTKDESHVLMRLISQSVLQLSINALKEDMTDESRRHIYGMLNVYQLKGLDGLNEKNKED